MKPAMWLPPRGANRPLGRRSWFLGEPKIRRVVLTLGHAYARPLAEPPEASALAERMRSALATALAHSSASLGVALARPDNSPASVLSRAHAALVRAKRLGRDRVESKKG